MGGSVRDELLGIKSKDIDYSVEAPSYDAMKAYIADVRKGTIFLESPEHFTIRAKIDGLGAADFVLCRKDGSYSDGRHPDSVEVGTLLDDLARRDFTMNAIAKAEDGTIHDPHHGAVDLSFGKIKCVGKAEDRFKEDSLRILRAIRFSITKELTLDGTVQRALRDNELVNLLINVPVERIREELVKCFAYDSYRTLQTLMYDYPYVGKKVFDAKNLWLKPTIIQET